MRNRGQGTISAKAGAGSLWCLQAPLFRQRSQVEFFLANKNRGCAKTCPRAATLGLWWAKRALAPGDGLKLEADYRFHKSKQWRACSTLDP